MTVIPIQGPSPWRTTCTNFHDDRSNGQKTNIHFYLYSTDREKVFYTLMWTNFGVFLIYPSVPHLGLNFQVPGTSGSNLNLWLSVSQWNYYNITILLLFHDSLPPPSLQSSRINDEIKIRLFCWRNSVICPMWTVDRLWGGCLIWLKRGDGVRKLIDNKRHRPLILTDKNNWNFTS